MRKTVQFRTMQFQCAHGKHPKGHGLWAFATAEGRMFCVQGLFSHAKQQAAKWAQTEGVTVLFVCS